MQKNTPLIRWIACLLVVAVFGMAVSPFTVSTFITRAPASAPETAAVVSSLKVNASLDVSTQTTYEAKVLKLINAERTKRGLKKLSLNTKLRTAARAHSKDMAKNDFFSHTGSSGSSMTDRLSKVGYKYSAAGETLYAGNGQFKTPEQCVKAWLNSPGHAAIMLSSSYTQVGIGYYYDSTSPYGAYYTADFGKPR